MLSPSRLLLLPAFAACFAALQGCGFQPLYGAHGVQTAHDSAVNSVQSTLALVKINVIPDREGQFLYNALVDRFYRHGYPSAPLYRLDVQPIRETQVDLDITKNATATRAQLKLDTTFNLFDAAGQTILLKRTLRSVTSYNVLNSEFATRVSEQAARENALNDLAGQIETEIALYFKRKED